jgi:prophage tail gpP-like protein
MDMEKRFSYYRCFIVDEQGIEEGSEIPQPSETAENASNFVEATDDFVRRWRPACIEMDTNYKGTVPEYADWFRRIERARSQAFTITLRDFFPAGGGIYTIGDRCTLDLRDWGIYFEGLIISTDYSLDPDNGRKLSIQVIDLDQYLPEPMMAQGTEPIDPISASGVNPFDELEEVGAYGAKFVNHQQPDNTRTVKE